MAARRRPWLAGPIAVVALLVLGNLVNGATLGWTPSDLCVRACFWIMLLSQSAPSTQVVRAAGVEPAQRLRTEGF